MRAASSPFSVSPAIPAVSRWAAWACSVLLAVACCLGVARAETNVDVPTIDRSIGHVDILLDLPKDVPYVGEMILLRMRTTIRADVALDEIRQPQLTNFNWQQLGRDKPIHVMVDGFDVAGYERDIAIFPQQAGRLIIDPFVRHVTLVVGNNQRVETDFASKPVYLDVQRHEGISSPDQWWLPAKSVRYRESWSPAPDAIEPGMVTRRIVTIEAAGTTADRLPPPPLMRAPGVITFTGPATRETILTADGPIARATYQWDIRPVTITPAKLPAIHIPWFDMTERRMRDTAIPDQWVSYIGAESVKGQPVARSFAARLLSSGPLAAGLAGFVWMAAVAGLAVASKPAQGGWTSLFKQSRLGAVRRAARRGDIQALKAALLALARSDPPRWQTIESDAGIATLLAQLDKVLYAKEPGALPPLRPLADAVVRAWREAASAERGRSRDALMPLDGAGPPKGRS